MRLVPIMLLAVTLIALVVCSGGLSGPTPTLAPLTKLVDTPEEIEDLEEMRRLAFAYWEAFNANAPDTLLPYMEDGYRAEKE